MPTKFLKHKKTNPWSIYLFQSIRENDRILAQHLVSFSGAHTTKFDYCAPNCNHILISSTNTYIYIKNPLPIPESLSKSILGGGASEVALHMESSKYFPVLTALPPPLPSQLAMSVLLPSPLTLLRIRGSSSEIGSKNLVQNLNHLVPCYEHLYTIYP